MTHLDDSPFFTGTPLIFLVPWVFAKYLYENQEYVFTRGSLTGNNSDTQLEKSS